MRRTLAGGLNPLALMILLAAALALPMLWSPAQAGQLQDQLPAWAARQLADASTSRQLEIFSAINPFFQRGDFDGDGRADLAILVQAKSTGKIGILFVYRSGKSILLGAGRSFGKAGDDFAWVERWSVEDGGTGQRRSGRSASKPRADVILVARQGSTSGLIYFRDGS